MKRNTQKIFYVVGATATTRRNSIDYWKLHVWNVDTYSNSVGGLRYVSHHIHIWPDHWHFMQCPAAGHSSLPSLQTNQRPVSRSRDHSQPMRGQYPGHSSLPSLQTRVIVRQPRYAGGSPTKQNSWFCLKDSRHHDRSATHFLYLQFNQM